MDALQFLAADLPIGSLYVLHGEEAFLKRRALRELRRRALGDDADEQAFSTHAGDHASFADVFDDLHTLPFFYPKRVVLVENADPFVTRHRADLELRWAQLPATGVLILDVKTWAANTRLAKLTPDGATLVCKPPPAYKLPAWCAEWAKTHHGRQLAPDAATLLVDLVGPEMGLLDQEIAKLSVYVGQRPRISAEDVDKLVGNNREQNTWLIFDAMAAGDFKQTLGIIQKLFDQGEEPMRLAGAFAFQMRKLVQAARQNSAGLPLNEAVARAGFAPFAQAKAVAQLQHLGRRRLDRVYDWILKLNMDLRGDSSLPPQTLFERLVIRLTRAKA